MPAPIELQAKVLGEGSPVVLVHSSGMSSRQWRRLAEALSAQHRTIAPDLIGSGQSPRWPADAPFHYERDVDALATLLHRVGEPVHLVGHSYGGLLALTLARNLPGSVRSLAVYDPVAFGVLRARGDAEGLADLAKAGANPIFHDDAVGGTEPWFELFVDYWNGAGAWRALPQPARDAFLAVGRKVYLEVSSLMADATPATAHAAITAPTLLLGGGQSPPAARRVVAVLGEVIAGARITTIEGAGHMGPMTHPDAVNEAVAAHIAAAR